MDFIRKNLYLILGTALVLGALFFATNPPKNPNPTPTSEQNQNQTFVIEQKINYAGLKPEETTNNQVTEDQSALDLLNKTKSIEIKESSYGKLVDSIEGVKNNTDSKYWLYYINGEPASVGAADYMLKQNDKIEWRFQSGG